MNHLKNVFLVFFSFLNLLFLNGQTYNVLNFGAKGDGTTLNTQALQKAIDQVADNGGGTLWIPAGTFLTGELVIKSNITLHLDNGAVLLGSPNIADYSKTKKLISGENIQNFALTGKGIINGNGQAFFTPDWQPKDRPEPWIKILGGENITFRDVKFINAPSHVLDVTNCDGVIFDGITIKNDARAPNTDGLDIRNSRNIRVANCHIETGDDAICLKSSKVKTGEPKYLCENIVVTNCIIKSDDAGLKLGTGSAYLTRNCVFSNCIIQDTRFAIALYMGEGGSIENYQFQNIVIQGKSRHPTDYPIFMDIDRKSAEFSYGKIKGISFSDMTIETRGNILIGGQKGSMVEDIVFDNVKMTFSETVDLSKMNKPRGNRFLKRLEGSEDFASQNAHISIGNAKNVVFRNSRLIDKKNGFKRPPFFIQNTEGVQKEGLILEGVQ